jgi:transcriptional antiterminator
MLPPASSGGEYVPPEKYEILKIFNNNVVLAKHLQVEKILIKKGLGFGKKTGDFLEAETTFDKIFVIENQETRFRFNQLITQIDENLVGICEEIFYMISLETGDALNEDIHVRLIDHIAFTLYRIKNNDKIDNPFLVEIETLYGKEMEIAAKAMEMLEKNVGIPIPDGEIGFIALHIHSLKNQGKLSNTIKYAYLCNSAVELIEDDLGVAINRKSIDYARFVTHVRFAVERLFKGIPTRNELLSSIRNTYKDSFTLAEQVGKLIESEIHLKISEEETGYLAMHIERLRNASQFGPLK